MGKTSETRRRRGPGRPSNPVPRDKLLAIARDTFAERGYAGASMAAIAERAGIRKSSLFHHFSSKDALYDEVFGSVLDELALLLTQAVAPGRPFLDRLDQLGWDLTGHLGANPAVARLILREITSRGPVLERPGSTRIQEVMLATAAFLASGMDEGAVDHQDPNQLAVSIVGLHLTCFAAPEVSGALLGGDVFAEAAVERRREAVREQIRRLVGAPVAVSS